VRARQRLFDSQPIATLSLILGLITVGTTVAAAADPVQNFGSPLSIPSPDGRFVAGSYLANPEEVETQGPEYDLFIRAQRTGKERILTRFMRSADVHWSPDSRHVAVTFWASSSDSHVVVYSPDSPGDREGLCEVLRGIPISNELPKRSLSAAVVRQLTHNWVSLKCCALSLAVGLIFGCVQIAPQAPLDGLGGTSWQLVKFQGGDGAVLMPDDKVKYTIPFTADGTLNVRFDCNRGRGTWTSPGPNQLQFGPLALTRAMCPPGSLHDHIVRQWPFVRSYTISGGNLFLSLMADGGSYEFEPIR